MVVRGSAGSPFQTVSLTVAANSAEAAMESFMMSFEFEGFLGQVRETCLG